MNQGMKKFYVGVFAFRVNYPEAHEEELLEEIAGGDAAAQKELDEFRSAGAAGLCSMEAYRLKYPQVFEQELEAA